MEWVRDADGSWRRVDDLKDLEDLLESTRSLTAESREHIAHSRAQSERVRRLLLCQRLARSSRTPPTVH